MQDFKYMFHSCRGIPMILRLLLSFFVGLTFVTASYAAIEDQISEFMLDNGMQVV
jgi:hypothetical protein